MELVINLNDDLTRAYDPDDTQTFRTLPGSVVVGAHSEYFVIDTAEQHSVAGVHFHPGGAFPFFGLPAGELRNRMVSLADLWGRRAAELREQVLEAPTPGLKLALLERALLALLVRSQPRHPAVAFALGEFRSAPHTRTISSLTGQIGLSPKRFIQVFDSEVGLTPKLFCRIRRFQRALRLTHKGRPVDWAGVAAECGYFDQAHFIRDFRAFSGVNPSRYIEQCTEHLNHLPLAG